MPTAEGKMDFGLRQMIIDFIISKLGQFFVVARQVPALWYLCALFGTAVTAILAVVILWLANWWLLAGVICGLIALGALGASLVWRARLEDSERIWEEGWNLRHRQRWYLHQGYRFLLWFGGHNLLWVSLGVVGAFLIIKYLGLRSWTLAATAAALSCAFYSLIGLWWLRRPLTLAVCWPLELGAVRGYWARNTAAVRLYHRHAFARWIDRKSFYRYLVATWADTRVEVDTKGSRPTLSTGEKPNSDAFRHEIYHRALAFSGPFLAVFVLSLPIFGLIQKDLQHFALAFNTTVIADMNTSGQPNATISSSAGSQPEGGPDEQGSSPEGGAGGNQTTGEAAAAGEQPGTDPGDEGAAGEPGAGGSQAAGEGAAAGDQTGTSTGELEQSANGESGEGNQATGDGPETGSETSGGTGEQERSPEAQESEGNEGTGDGTETGEASSSGAGDQEQSPEGQGGEGDEATAGGTETDDASGSSAGDQEQSPEGQGSEGDQATAGGTETGDASGSGAGDQEQSPEGQGSEDESETGQSPGTEDGEGQAPGTSGDQGVTETAQQNDDTPPQLDSPTMSIANDSPGPRIEMSIPAMIAVGTDAETGLQSLHEQGEALQPGSPQFVPQRQRYTVERQPLQRIPNWILGLSTDFWSTWWR